MHHTIKPSEICALQALRSQARRSAAFQLKRHARYFSKRAMSFEALYSGLSTASPATMIAIAEHLLEMECDAPQRWFGFGGEMPGAQCQSGIALRSCAPPRIAGTMLNHDDSIYSGIRGDPAYMESLAIHLGGENRLDFK